MGKDLVLSQGHVKVRQSKGQRSVKARCLMYYLFPKNCIFPDITC